MSRRLPSRPGSSRHGKTLEGRVVRLQSRHAVVHFADGKSIRCTFRKSLFKDIEKGAKPVAVGDTVIVTRFGPRDAVVEEVLPRRGYLARRNFETGRDLVMVANVDQVLVVVSVKEPELRPRLIDRILVAAERGGFGGHIALTKSDLLHEDERKLIDDIAAYYRSMEYGTTFTSVVSEEGIEELRELLKDKTTVLTGQSGVGKSTLINCLEPGLNLPTQVVSDKWGKGKHTTSSSYLLPLKSGGFVVDTPGVRSWGIAGLEPSDIAIFFPDLAPFVDDCRYNECIHEHEPECAVKDAVDEGKIPEWRYDSYLRIILGMDDT